MSHSEKWIEQPIIVYKSRQDEVGLGYPTGTTFGQVRNDLHVDESVAILRNIGARSLLDFYGPNSNDLVIPPGIYSAVRPGQIRDITVWDELRWWLRSLGW